jgi:hypothetical protein
MRLESVLTAWTTLDEGALARPWTFRGGTLDARNALYWTLVEAQHAVTRATDAPHPESRRILALAQRAFGDLRGLLVGLPDDLLDKAPAHGEWSVREVLAHVVNVEQRYAIQTAYAVERTDADPLRIAADRLPPLTAGEVGGDVGTLLSHLGAERAATDRRLGALSAAAMTRPTVWVHLDVDVRFRLHRFAAHIAEHTIQSEKTLTALGWRQTEARRIVRQIWSFVGELEGLGADTELSALTSLAEEHAAAL